MKFIFPELTTNSIAQEAIKCFKDIEFFSAHNLNEAAKLLQKSH